MTKVNYFEAEGKNSKKETGKQIFYARSKKDVMKIAKGQGFFIESLDSIRELNYKSQVLTMLDIKKMFEIRTRDKKFWKEA